jgi:hypothetical protein
MTPLRALIDALEQDTALDRPDALRERLDALDRIELLQLSEVGDEPAALRQRVAGLRQRLDDLNAQAYRRMRETIRRGATPPLLTQCLVEAHHDFGGGDGYDWRDELIDGVLQPTLSASPQTILPAEMVAYQPTPARHIFSLLAQAPLGADDVLVDLGSGLGHVPLLAAICTEANAIGIEREPAYVASARAAADALQLSKVRFECSDARAADLAHGTIFYLYTPFSGALLQSVLDALQCEAAQRAIRVAAHGPCVAALAAQPWLQAITPPHADRITLFRPR